MKKLFLLLIIVCLAGPAYLLAQPGLSPLTRKYLSDLQSAQSGQQYVLKKAANGSLYASALIRVSDERIAAAGLAGLHAVIGTKAGRVWTVKVPVDHVSAFTQLAGIDYIQLDEPVKPHLNIVRSTTHADSAQKGIGLALPYSGKNVVVGIIDFGFDYKHPTFYDTLGTRFRIKKVWELNGTGTPPQGYTYGRELADTNAIKAQQTDNPYQTHGTGVGGIAAGSGYGSPLNSTKLRGIAYEADIVMVGVRRDSIGQQWMEGSFSDFIDGINYIFTYAASVHKPAVVNISWGSQSGPHDGSTLFNEACNNLAGSGRIIVMSAGNEGEEKIHLSKTFTPADTLLSSFLDFTKDTYKRTWVDAWGEAEKTFCAQVTLYKNGVAGNTTGMHCIDGQVHSMYLIGANGTDTCSVDLISSPAEFNGKPRFTLAIFNKAADSVAVSFRANEGTVHLWNEYYYYGYTYGYQSSFNSHGYPWAQTGNTTTTVSDMGSGASVLLVGAYASKVSYVDISNNPWSYSSYVGVGKLVPFSSRGPMLDGRIKPDITAPGLTIATACNSYDSAYTPGGASSTSVVSGFTHPVSGRRYYYAEFSGTSASAPVTSGIVALMLQANPSLFPSHVQSIMAQTAITDTYTGSITSAGNNDWGHGKINAYAAVKGALQVTGMAHTSGVALECGLYPNPNHGSFNLDFTGTEKATLDIAVFNSSGAEVYVSKWETATGNNQRNLDLGGMPAGLYVVRVSTATGVAHIRMIVE